ncbi:MAG: 23S rRNA (guanosine(2251)-2'-O)-methyltransferase RlmB [Ruminococcus sp.]
MSQRKPQPRRGQKPADAPETENDRIAGRNPVLEALRSDAKIDLIYVGQESGGLQEIIRLAKEKGIPVKVVTESKLSQLTGGAVHQGVAAEGACGTYVSLEELLERAAEKGEPPLLVLCDGIQDPHNLGAIIRTAEAAGAHGVVIPKRRSASLTLTVGKTSAGAASWLPVARVPNLASAMETLKKNGVWIWPQMPQAQAIRMRLHRRHGVCHRLRGLWHEPPGERKCDAMLSLPMRGRSTLNASVAAGIFMYEAVRQRLAMTFYHRSELMADHKFTLEEILNEYSEDGRRSGIRHTSDKPLSHGTLETEKLVNAATSSRPLRQEQAGYDQVVPELSAGDEEQLVDIKSTISHIKADKAAQAARDVDAAPVLRERFPTQHLRRENVSFVKAAGAARYGASYPENGDSGYDGAVMLAEPETEEPAEKHRPNVRQMQDSTRAREKNRKRRRRSPESTYLKESVTGEFQRPDARTVPEEPPASRRHWEEEKDYYYQEKQQTGSFRPIRQRVRSHTFGKMRTSASRMIWAC